MSRRGRLRIKMKTKEGRRRKLGHLNAKWESGHEWLVFDAEKKHNILPDHRI